MKKLIAFFLSAALILSLFAGCGQAGKEQSDTLRIMGLIKTENLDPLVGVSHDPNLMSSIFGALIRRGEDGLEPGIIQEWNLSNLLQDIAIRDCTHLHLQYLNQLRFSAGNLLSTYYSMACYVLV